MATSGSFNTGSIGNFYVTFEWQRLSYDSNANTNRIYWKLTAHNTPGNYRTVYHKGLSIKGQPVYSNDTGIQYYNDNVIADGEMTLQCDDSSGNCSFYAYFEAGVGISSGANVSGDGNFYLDQIPRYAEINQFYVQSTGLTSAIIYYAVSRTAHIYCSVDGQSWGSPRVTNTTSGTFTITGLSPGARHSFAILSRAVDSGLDRVSGTIYGNTKDIARISSAPNMNHGDSLTVTYTNPSGSAMQISLTTLDGSSGFAGYRTCTGSSYTFNFTDSELDKIYKAYGNNRSLNARVYIKTDGTYLDYKQITINLNGNQKTIHKKVSGNFKRGKMFIKINNTFKRGVVWEREGEIWKRAI